MMKLGTFRKQEVGESDAQYFKAAVFKAAGGKDSDPTHESLIQRFIAIAIGKAGSNRQMLNDAYRYAVHQFKAKGKLHLCTEEAFVPEAAWGRAASNNGPAQAGPTRNKTNIFYFLEDIFCFWNNDFVYNKYIFSLQFERKEIDLL